VYIHFSKQKFGDKESKSKNAADAEKFVDDDIIPRPECSVSVMGSICAGGPGIVV
jgi:hypothetical protein